ncbi:MAG: 16S rRNA (uracil(1498)-N(3))-methyltransferase [Candidatus Doudnabacteria bacterium]|nr:16S rRNA (uracil(1498)-N(3))-methyltransferase [Candidatus Doudnabacteria bacterium]
MSYFIHTTELATGQTDTLTGEEAHHAALSRRSRVGERLEIQTPSGKRYSCVITQIQKGAVVFTVESELPVPPDPSLAVTLCVAHSSEHALDFIIQKATELGAAHLCIFQAEHSPHPPKAEKLNRWHKISTEAAKQCGRQNPLRISLAGKILETLETKAEANFYATMNGVSIPTLPVPTPKSVQIWIGPEGGFGTIELTAFASNQILPVRLPGFTLRTETAAITALAILLSQSTP